MKCDFHGSPGADPRWEAWLDQVIDDLNEGRAPELPGDREEADLQATIRLVKSMGQPPSGPSVPAPPAAGSDRGPRRLALWLASVAADPWELQLGAALGRLPDGSPVEVTARGVRWVQGMPPAGESGAEPGPTQDPAPAIPVEIAVQGPGWDRLARQLAPGLELPDPETDLVSRAQVPVLVDMEAAQADQQQVDGGHSPWRLDPIQVAMAFVNLLVAPDGISGEPAVDFGSFSLTENTGGGAVLVRASPFRYDSSRNLREGKGRHDLDK